MKLIDGIAILGALAWTPHLFSLIKSYFTKSKVTTITARTAEIGFSTFGPVFNLNLAFSTEYKDIVATDLKVYLKHSSGEEIIFEWQGIKQNVGKMTTQNDGVMPLEREHSVLAIKLNQSQIEERFINLQTPSFLKAKRKYEEKVIKQITYLKEEGKYHEDDFLRSLEMTDLYSFNKHAFNWKEGEYTTTIKIESPDDFILTDNVRTFYLTPVDIEKLTKNKECLETAYRIQLLGKKAGESDVKWEWLYPELHKKLT